MHKSSLVSVILVLHVTLCSTIRVPVVWTAGSEVKYNEPIVKSNTNEEVVQKPIPNQYFEYTAKKPQFAIDIAAAHDVKSPEKHFSAYPIRPYTDVEKPELGKHHMLDPEKESFYPFQRFISANKDVSYVTPVSTSYEVYHPYKAEEPALQEIYKDPVLEKIRNDLRDSKNRLQKYENDAGHTDVTKDEYLESPEKTDYKYTPQKNKHAQFEIHRPLRRPIYYRPPSRYSFRDNMLNKKLRHPWNQNYAKVTPFHYRPIKNHIHHLRQQHALKFDDEHNEYPQLPLKESLAEKPDGYDIYEKGKDKFLRLRDNVDLSINKAVLQNRPYSSEKLELKPNHDINHLDHNESQEDDFIPIKNYAQVRKTETTKHLPRLAAFKDADSLDEIKNAPRLREAVKSTKAQVVYSEEGYEDSAYDHAGEQKHASDIENHGGFLKENELSGGKYKTPSISGKIEDAGGSTYRDQVIHGEKWKADNQDSEDETDSEDYSENEQEDFEDTDIHADNSNVETVTESEVPGETSEDNKDYTDTSGSERHEISDYDSSARDINEKHVMTKREFNVPKINFNSTYLTGDKITKEKIIQENKNNTEKDIKSKYPYYLKKSLKLSNDSPLRYAENLKFIPKKTLGGTEFYDSRKDIICPTVEEDVDPIPEKIKKGGNPDDDVSDKGSEFDQLKNKQRLGGLGDKIDCLKSKFFGENPLDSPFFKEDIIASPIPITKPKIGLFVGDKHKQLSVNKYLNNQKFKYIPDIFEILDQRSKIILNESIPTETPIITNLEVRKTPVEQIEHDLSKLSNKTLQNASYSLIDGIETTNSNHSLISRKKRATPFMYEPYKIIKESQVVDSKKTTTTNNISPLIKQLQSSRVVDRVTANQNKDQVVKRNTNTKHYRDIGKGDRPNQHKNETNDFQERDFIDVSIDKRRGEPRYEIKHRNHKNYYNPVKNITSISLDEYRDQTGFTDIPHDSMRPTLNSKANLDMSKYLHSSEETQNSAASNSVNKIIFTTTLKPTTTLTLTDENDEHENNEHENDEEYYDYDSEKKLNSGEKKSIVTTTTTTEIPLRRRKPVRIITTLKPTLKVEETNNDKPMLQLKTRFRTSEIVPDIKKTHPTNRNDYTETAENIPPKLREKKKNISKSTIVTDTKSYGEEDDDDMRKKDIDALIGVQYDTDEYLPEYEKQQNKKVNSEPDHDEKIDEDEYDDGDSDDDDSDDEEDEEEEDDEDVIDSQEQNDEVDTTTNQRLTTPEPTKRTLPKTTETTRSTTEISIQRHAIKPTVTKKRIEVHRELPVDKKSPNVTHFMQDIKEIEIIKTIPSMTRQKSRKNLEALDLYKDENLAKDVNKLGGVEVFKENLDLTAGPKHGGNYRSIEEKDVSKEPSKKDVEASQSEYKKKIESKDIASSSRRRGNIKNSKLELIDTTETPVRHLHGGNLKHSPRRGRNKNEKIIELTDNNEGSLQLHGGNLKARRGKNNERNNRGDNFKSSDIVEDPDEVNSELSEKKTKHDPDRNGKAAALLNSYVQAVPILTTPLPFIVDPSKRRYYYVDV